MNDEQLNHHIADALHEVADALPVRDRLDELRDGARPDPRENRWLRAHPLLAGAGAFAAVIVVLGGVLLALRGATDEPAENVQTDGTTTTTTTTLAPTTAPDIRTQIAIGSAAEGFAPVEDALTEAQDLWAKSSLPGYGYLLEIDCDCPAASSTWVRRWPDRHEDILVGTPEDLFSQIRTSIDEEPEVIEVEFSTIDGHPVSYRVVDEDGEKAATIDHFHEIREEGSPFDGSWRLVSGTIDGESFGNPATGGIFLEFGRGRVNFPIDCNRAGGYVDIYDGWFGISSVWQTLAGCGETAPETVMFTESIDRAETIRLSGTTLLLGGPGVELSFTTPTNPELLGELPLTAAGERLSFDAPGQESTNRYIIAPSLDSSITPTIDSFGRRVSYLLTAESADSDATATWQRWQGEPDDLETRTSGTDPHTIVVPDDIVNGDYFLCSPYWEPDPFCYILRVRLPSAPWIVSAGPAGVILHDANGTSAVISEIGAQIAFLVGDRLVLQPINQPDRILIDGTEVSLQPGALVLDAGNVAGRTLALVSGPERTTTIDLDTNERTEVGPSAVEGRLFGGGIILRTTDTELSARNFDGVTSWRLPIDPEAMVTLNGEDQVRLDTFRVLQTEAGPEPYFQYIRTEILDLRTGEPVDSYEMEVGIPFEGHHIDQRCVRAEFQDGSLLCPQPDGRIIILEGETLAEGSTATYARPAK